jgi:acyl-CoA thioester hydrolase
MHTLTSTIVEYGRVEPFVVHFDDLDALGIMHNARYAVFLERALSTFWSRHGYSFSGGVPTKPDVVHAVAEYAISYKTPIRGTGEVGVHFWVDRLGETSVVYGFRIVSADGDLVHAEGRRVNIKLDPVTFRPSPWTAESRQIATTLLRSAAA